MSLSAGCLIYTHAAKKSGAVFLSNEDRSNLFFLMGINMAAHPCPELHQNTDLTHLSQWELPLELLCPDSCCASRRIFSMSPLWMEDEEGTCSSPPFFPLPLSLPLLLFMGSSTQELLRPAGGGRDCSPSSQLLLLLCKGGGCSTKWDDIVRKLEDLRPLTKDRLRFTHIL